MRLSMPSLHAVAAVLCLSLMTCSFAQERTPAQQALAATRFTIISPFPAGGPTDVLARTLAEGLSSRYGQPAVVENLAGAAGNIGMDRAKRARPNGHTLLVVPAGNITINPTLMPDFPFDIQRDFTAITKLTSSPNVLLVNSNSRIDSVQALIAQAKAQPDSLTYASPGVGSGLHLAGELFKQNAGVDILHVAYRGTGPAINDVLGGVVPVMFSSLFAALPHMQSGKLKALATTSALRSALVPELATLKELGVAGVDVTSWYGLFGPSAMDAEIAEQLARDAAEIFGHPIAIERLRLQGMLEATQTPAAFTQHINDETDVWRQLLQERTIQPE